MINLKLEDAAAFVGGKISGNKNLNITNVARIDEANSGDLTFLYLPAYEKYFQTTKASAILVKPGFKLKRDDISLIEVEDPNKAFYKIIIRYFTPEFRIDGIDPTAFVHPTARLGKSTGLGKNVIISEGCEIGDNVNIFHNTVILPNVKIGDDSLLFQNISIRENCILGKRVIIHAGTVIGSDGFGFYPDEKGVYHKIPQIGNVVIEDDVELGSNVSVDRAALGSTIIRKGVKIDNLVQVAHNVEIGENTVISSQSGISGSTKVGNDCQIGGQVGIVGHVEIADHVLLAAQSGVSKGISKPGAYFGAPAKEIKLAMKLEAHIRNLPNYSQTITELQKEIKSLKDEINQLKKG
ncbi:MAG: UDP-3-O-(3-hydroxymyristoyl)glucosamine N-acyltransferase [Ignavibacteriales bacterium]|nr:MAG: UDP-3-O-(3-hydroxymyristoyl)glucosamine N-acyltransferase [Ignavibacteriales bacterium]